VKTNHFSKQQCVDTYEFSVVYKVYFLRLYSLSAKYVSVHIYVDSHIFSLYITLRSKIILFWSYFNLYTAFRAMAIVVMKRDSYNVICHQGNAIVTW